MASLATTPNRSGGGSDHGRTPRRRPLGPGEREKLTAWGQKWGKLVSDAAKQLRSEGR